MSPPVRLGIRDALGQTLDEPERRPLVLEDLPIAPRGRAELDADGRARAAANSFLEEVDSGEAVARLPVARNATRPLANSVKPAVPSLTKLGMTWVCLRPWWVP